jgi:ribosomal-protein-alanine N-acetyltransferase
MILKTDRLNLRPLTAEDAPAIHLMMSDADVMAFRDSDAIDDPAMTAEIILSQISETATGKAFYWTIERAIDGVLLGVCDLSEIDTRHARAEIGFLAGAEFWIDGYSYEALHAVIGHAAQSLRLRRLQARVHLANTRSTRLVEQLGFEREGLLRGYVDRDGERRDCFLFGLLL